MLSHLLQFKLTTKGKSLRLREIKGRKTTVYRHIAVFESSSLEEACTAKKAPTLTACPYLPYF